MTVLHVQDKHTPMSQIWLLYTVSSLSEMKAATVVRNIKGKPLQINGRMSSQISWLKFNTKYSAIHSIDSFEGKNDGKLGQRTL